MGDSTYDASFAEWRRILKPLTQENGGIPHLNGHVIRLVEVLAQVEEVGGQQRSLAAAKQEMSQQLKVLVVEGRKIAAFLKSGLREHYGRKAEKLTEYGLQPFRGNKAAKPEESVELDPPSPASSTPTF